MNERHVSFRQERKGRLAWWIGGGVVAVAIAAAYFYYTHKVPDASAAQPVAAQPTAPAPEASAEASILYPVPAPESQQGLPTLAESDDTALGALAEIIGGHPADQLLVPDGIIKRIVVTVDNLPLDRLDVERRPVKSTPGSLVVDERGEVMTLGADNHSRYTPFIDVVRAADPALLAAAYFRFYPLFQQAYEELGYNGKYFNDRVVEVIDHLLQTPDLQGPIRLVRPNVFYEFEDADLEARSAGQKLLIRMGNENAGLIKQKLRDLRSQIVRGTKEPQ